MASDPSLSGQSYFVDRWRKLAFRLRIKGDAKLVLLALVENHATYEDGSNCYPSIDTIVWHTELSRRTVQRSLDLLEERGILKRIPCVGTSNLYEFGDADELEKTIPERPARPVRQAPAPTRHMRQADTSATLTPPPCHTDTPPVSEGHPPCVSLTPYHSHITPSSNTLSEEAAATRTHESAPTHEGQPPAAGQGLDLEKPDRGRQAAASEQPAQTSTEATQDEASEELVVWLGTTLKERCAALVQTPGEVRRGQVKAALRKLKRWAGRDEGRVRAYLADELDRQEGRDEGGKARQVATLIDWLADLKAWERWQAAASAPATSLIGNKPIHRGRPPRPGMVWNEHINDWTNATAIHTGLFKRINLGSDDDDIVYDPTKAEVVG